jgi:hypothetical protein
MRASVKAARQSSSRALSPASARTPLPNVRVGTLPTVNPRAALDGGEIGVQRGAVANGNRRSGRAQDHIGRLPAIMMTGARVLKQAWA